MIGEILLAVLLVIVVAAMLAPFSALSWWARQGEDQARAELAEARALVSAAAGDPVAEEVPVWLVYMTGVGATSELANPVGEQPFLDDLAAACPQARIVCDVYPYDVANRGLLRDRPTSRFWRGMERLSRSKWFRLAPVIIYGRNVLQFMVSADDRYGPMYSIGVAKVVWDRLRAAGYDPRSRRPVVLLGWSGGAQIAASTATYLGVLGVPLYLISMGGVVTADPGLDRLSHVWHLKGTRDHVQAVGRVFPGRWRSATPRGSSWVRAVRDGRLTEHVIGDQQHLGRGSYLSRAKAPDGRTYRQVSVDEVAARIAQVAASH